MPATHVRPSEQFNQTETKANKNESQIDVMNDLNNVYDKVMHNCIQTAVLIKQCSTLESRVESLSNELSAIKSALSKAKEELSEDIFSVKKDLLKEIPSIKSEFTEVLYSMKSDLLREISSIKSGMAQDISAIKIEMATSASTNERLRSGIDTILSRSEKNEIKSTDLIDKMNTRFYYSTAISITILLSLGGIIFTMLRHQ